jgi:hypothetical protein
MSVTVPPGATAFTVIFLCPQSLDMIRTNESIAPLEPEYRECFGTLKSLAVLEDMSMIRPPSLRWRYASRATKNWPRVLRLNTRSNSSYSVRINIILDIPSNAAVNLPPSLHPGGRSSQLRNYCTQYLGLQNALWCRP